jgi:signal transduction histidine kinase
MVKPSFSTDLPAGVTALVLDQIYEGLLILGADWQVTYVNTQGASLLGFEPSKLIGHDFWECFTNLRENTGDFYEACQRSYTTQLPLELPDYAFTDHRSLQIRLVPFSTGLILYLQNLTTQKQAYARLRYYDAKEQLLVAIDQRIRQSVDLEEILNTVVVEIRNFLEADRVLIYRFDEAKVGHLVAIACQVSWQLTNAQQNSAISPLWNLYPKVDYTAGESNPCAAIAPGSHVDNLIESSELLQIQANLNVPILQDQRPWGILMVHQCSSPREWQPLEVLLLRELAAQIALAIQQSELYWRTLNLNADLERQVLQRTAELEQEITWEAMLKRITDRVQDSLDENQILQQAVEELALALRVGSCNAALYDLDQGTSTIYYEYTTNMPAAQGRIAKMGDYPELYKQLLQGEYFQFCSINPSPVRGRVTMLACPIFDNEGILGDLWLVNQAAQFFSEGEIRFVQQAANQCAIALRQAKLYQAAQAQVAKLEELNRLKDEFLSTVSHELRAPMTNMKMAILMLDVAIKRLRQEPVTSALEAWAGLEQRVSYYLEILRKECEREIQLINDLLDLQRLEANAQLLDLETLDLQDWLPQRIALFQDRIRDRQQTLKLQIPDNLPCITTDVDSLDRILTELLNNACKYTPPGEEIGLQVTLTAPGIELEVSNSGVEIPQEELTKIFEKFYRVPSNDPWKQGGTGLGLALIKKLIQHLGGSIQVQSQNQLTCFTVYLPISS